MFGKIINITDSTIVVEMNKNEVVIPNLMNLYVIFEENNNKLLGEVRTVLSDTIQIDLKGEFIGEKFIAGTIRKPSLSSNVRVINDLELSILLGQNTESNIYIGKSPIYKEQNIYADINDLFSNHLSILGNSGSGKSCSVSRIVQNIFLNKNFLTYNANLFFFDAYGEYKNAFKSLSEINPNYQYKFLTTNPVDTTDGKFVIPIFLLSVDDLALLLQATEHSQITIIERMYKLVRIFSRNDDNAKKLKNHLIAKAILNIMFSNQSSNAKKSDIFEIITNTNTDEFNLKTEIQGVGYTRIFSECFGIDRNGEFGESILLNEYLNKFVDDSLERTITVPEQAFFTLKDLAIALNFTLIGEGFQENKIIQDAAIILKVRLNSIINSPNSAYFNLNEYVNLENYISSLIMNNNKRSQIININLEGIDDNLAKVLVKIIAKMLFDFGKSRTDKASIPFHLFIEEAHRYVVKDNDVFLLGYNIFERIAKEGRKNGVILDLISQRPVELNETVISQTSNFLILKITHPKDLEYIEKMLPNISGDVIDKLNSLQAGTLVAFGNAFKIPLLIKMDMPNPTPYSANCDVLNRWKG
ncbi:MAG: DUF87 domain-containing protein [Bacilli bacterium]|nr:DUF87 domain-containing protein [Bacilli bacterium]